MKTAMLRRSKQLSLHGTAGCRLLYMIFIASVYGQYKFCLFAGAVMPGVYYFDTAEGERRIFHKFCDTFTEFLNLVVTDEA